MRFCCTLPGVSPLLSLSRFLSFMNTDTHTQHTFRLWMQFCCTLPGIGFLLKISGDQLKSMTGSEVGVRWRSCMMRYDSLSLFVCMYVFMHACMCVEEYDWIGGWCALEKLGDEVW